MASQTLTGHGHLSCLLSSCANLIKLRIKPKEKKRHTVVVVKPKEQQEYLKDPLQFGGNNSEIWRCITDSQCILDISAVLHSQRERQDHDNRNQLKIKVKVINYVRLKG